MRTLSPRSRLASLASLGAALAVLAPACSSDPPPDDTCAFLADSNNCYRQLLAAVDDCLAGETTDGGAVSAGTLAGDGKSCTYSSGRLVTFGSDARQYIAAKAPLDVTVTVHGKICVHYVSQPQSSLTITQPDGRVLRVVVAGLGETITCPDGSEHGIDAQKIFGGCGGDAGSVLGGTLPGTVTGSGGSSVSGSLIGLKGQAYSCNQP